MVALVPLSPRGIVLIVAVLAAVLGVVAETIVLLADLEAGPCGERAIKSEMPVVIVSARAGCIYDTLLHRMTESSSTRCQPALANLTSFPGAEWAGLLLTGVGPTARARRAPLT